MTVPGIAIVVLQLVLPFVSVGRQNIQDGTNHTCWMVARASTGKDVLEDCQASCASNVIVNVFDNASSVILVLVKHAQPLISVRNAVLCFAKVVGAAVTRNKEERMMLMAKSRSMR